MDFAPPDRADLDNVYALNRAFLDGVCRPPAATGAAAELARLDASARERLAGCAFLLFTLGDYDNGRWQRAFDGGCAPDLLSAIDAPDPVQRHVAVSTLAFLWELARRRPYAARVVSGASLAWCERLARSSPPDLIAFVTSESSLIALRRRDDPHFWRALMRVATSEEAEVRSAARLTALQTVLTAPADDREARLPAAACSMPQRPRVRADSESVSRLRGHGYNTAPDESARNQTAEKDLRER